VGLVAVMAFFGIFILAPVNLRVLWELRKPAPNMQLVAQLMRLYLAVTAVEALLQLATVVVMTRFRLGL
jgi:cytochrome b561